MQYQLSRVVMGPALYVLGRPRVTGLEYVPASGPAILASNHLSFIDSMYLPLVIPALAGVTARPLAARLEPRQATWLLTSATVALAGCSTAALALLVSGKLSKVVVGSEGGYY